MADPDWLQRIAVSYPQVVTTVGEFAEEEPVGDSSGQTSARAELSDGESHSPSSTSTRYPRESTTMNELITRVTNTLDNLGQSYHVEENVVLVLITGGCCEQKFRIVVDSKHGFLTMYGNATVVIPEGCRPDVAEVVCRLNLGLTRGRCEMIYDAGYLGWYDWVHESDPNLDNQGLEGWIMASSNMLDALVASSLAVIYGNELPADAVRAAKIARGGSVKQDDTEDDDTMDEADDEATDE